MRLRPGEACRGQLEAEVGAGLGWGGSLARPVNASNRRQTRMVVAERRQARAMNGPAIIAPSTCVDGLAALRRWWRPAVAGQGLGAKSGLLGSATVAVSRVGQARGGLVARLGDVGREDGLWPRDARHGGGVLAESR